MSRSVLFLPTHFLNTPHILSHISSRYEGPACMGMDVHAWRLGGREFLSHWAGVLGSITICFLLSGFSQTLSLGPHVSCRLRNRQRQPLILAKRATFSGAHIDGDVAPAKISSLLTRPVCPRRKAQSTKNKHLVALLRGIVNRMAPGRELVFLVFAPSFHYGDVCSCCIWNGHNGEQLATRGNRWNRHTFVLIHQ